MVESGFQITCGGCGDTVFVAPTKYSRAKVEFFKSTTAEVSDLTFKGDMNNIIMYEPDQSESWTKIGYINDLCPRCHKIYEDMLCRFYERCGEAREKKQEETTNE